MHVLIAETLAIDTRRVSRKFGRISWILSYLNVTYILILLLSLMYYWKTMTIITPAFIGQATLIYVVMLRPIIFNSNWEDRWIQTAQYLNDIFAKSITIRNKCRMSEAKKVATDSNIQSLEVFWRFWQYNQQSN